MGGLCRDGHICPGSFGGQAWHSFWHTLPTAEAWQVIPPKTYRQQPAHWGSGLPLCWQSRCSRFQSTEILEDHPLMIVSVFYIGFISIRQLAHQSHQRRPLPETWLPIFSGRALPFLIYPSTIAWAMCKPTNGLNYQGWVYETYPQQDQLYGNSSQHRSCQGTRPWSKLTAFVTWYHTHRREHWSVPSLSPLPSWTLRALGSELSIAWSKSHQQTWVLQLLLILAA